MYPVRNILCGFARHATTLKRCDEVNTHTHYAKPSSLLIIALPTYLPTYLPVFIILSFIVCQILTAQDGRSALKQPLIEITNEQVGQELDLWFTNEECEAPAQETGFIQRSTSRLTSSGFPLVSN